LARAWYLMHQIIQGDALEVLSNLDADSIHLTVTSPPYYNARDYAQYESYDLYLDFLTAVFEQVHRVTCEGRFLVVNTSPVLVPREARHLSSKRLPIPYDLTYILTRNGWDFIEDIIWKKPEASVKNRNGGFFQHRKPLAYKPNAITENIMVYRKKTDKLIDWNLKKYDAKTTNASKVSDGYETSNVWDIAPCRDKIHSAVFPLELCDKVIQYYSFVGDTLLDPFAGSGTLGVQANKLGRVPILIERDSNYIKRIHERLKNEQ